MSRHRHPYFSQVNRRVESGTSGSHGSDSRTPLAKPKDQPGILWAAFREEQPQESR